MFKIALLDDDKNSLSELTKYLNEYFFTHELEYKIYTFTNGFDFLDSLKENFTIAFLDIDMPAINGLEVARKLRNIDKNIFIIFVTNMASCAINGYEVEAIDFLVKPIKKEQISFALNKVVDKLDKASYKKINIKTKSGYIAIKDYDIDYIEVSLHSLIFHTRNGEFETYGSLKDLENLLNDEKFVRCNSCYLVNLDSVLKIEGDECVLKNGSLQISRSKKKYFIQKFLENI